MTLFGRLFVWFVLVPVVELALLIQVGRMVGLWPTVLLVLGTGALGAALARREGMRVVLGFQQELASGRLPHQTLLDGVSVLVGGVLLLAPGFLTDLLGLALLFPATRRWIQARARRRLETAVQQGTVRMVSFGTMSGGMAGGSAGFRAAWPSNGGPGGPSSPTDDPGLIGLDPRHGIEVPADDR